MFKRYKDMTNKEKAYYLKACEQKCLLFLLSALLILGLFFTIMVIIDKPDYEIIMPVSTPPTEEVVK